jgi:hypothetical protein
MAQTIEEIEKQIAELQKTLEQLKNPKLTVTRDFMGEYFAPYQGRLFRRMESEGIPIWEAYLDIKENWVMLTKQESDNLEKIYHKDCIVKNTPDTVEEFMK